MRNNVLLIGILLLFVCKADAQDSFFDALEKGLAPHDGSLIVYQRDSPERTERSNIAEKMTAEAFLLLEKGDCEAAERRFREACATEIPGGRAQAWAQLGWAELCERQGRYSEAIGHFRTLYTLTGEHDLWQSELGDPNTKWYLTNEGTYIRSEAVTHMEYALTLAEADRWSEAVSEYEEALAHLVFKSLVYLRAVERLETGVQGRTIAFHTAEALEKAMPRADVFRYLPSEWNVHFQADRRRPEALKAMAHLFIGAHRVIHAFWPTARQLEHLRKAIDYDPANPYAYYEYGVALQEMKQSDAAGKALVLAGALAESNSELMAQINTALNRQSGTQASIKAAPTPLDTRLISAVLRQDTEEIKALLDQGAHIECPLGNYGDTPLMQASGSGLLESVKVLVSRGAQVNPKGAFHGRTPLTEAALRGRLDVVVFLIEHGANVNANLTRHGHAFSLAAEGIGPPNPTPLGSAAEGGQTAVVEYLLHKGAQVNGQDGSSYTPLMWACEVGHVTTVKALLRHGASVTVKTDRGQTAASMMREHLAARVQVAEYEEILALLDAVRPSPRKGGRDRGKEQHTGTNL